MMQCLFFMIGSLFAETPPLPSPASFSQAVSNLDGSQGAVVILGDARITIAPGTKMCLERAKTDRGLLLRLEVENVTVEAPEMRLQTAEMLMHFRVTPEGEMFIRNSRVTKP